MAQVSTRTYKIRKFQNGKSKEGKAFMNYSLTIPTALAEQLPEGMNFACDFLPEIQLPDDASVPEAYRGRKIQGILFEPVDERPKPQGLPEWAKAKQNGTGETKPERPRRARPGKQPAKAT